MNMLAPFRQWDTELHVSESLTNHTVMASWDLHLSANPNKSPRRTRRSIHCFFPRLVPIIKNTSLGQSTVWYVFGNKTHYTNQEDNIYVTLDDLIKFITQPCLDKHYHNTFEHVLRWKNGHFYEILGASWAKPMISIHNSEHTADTTKLVFQPVSIPLSFGYEWDKYPIHLYKPLEWNEHTLRKEAITAYEREQRSKKS